MGVVITWGQEITSFELNCKLFNLVNFGEKLYIPTFFSYLLPFCVVRLIDVTNITSFKVHRLVTALIFPLTATQRVN